MNTKRITVVPQASIATPSSEELETEKPPLLPIDKYFKDNLKKFLFETSVNGLKYICDLQRSIWERLYYLIAFIVVFISALYMTLYFLEKWNSNPVIISITPTTTRIQTSPFPAVTICNMNQALKSKVEGFSRDSPDYAFLQKICFQDYNYSRFHDFKPRFVGDTFGNFIVRNAQSCSDMIIYCKYGAEEEVCSDIFREVLLDDGLCCVFNQLHPFYLYRGNYEFVRDYTSSHGRSNIPVNWNLENGYEPPLPKSYYPRAAAGSGVNMGLTVILNARLDDYYCSSTNGEGFKVLLYNPIDAPYIKENGLPAMLGYQTQFLIGSKSMTATASLRSMSPRDRYCYFTNEKTLLYFKHYTRRNCEMECDSRVFLRNCKCIPYFLPLIYSNASVCSLNQMNCVVDMEKALFHYDTIACKEQCLAGCHELTYFPHSSGSQLALKNFNLHDSFFRNVSKEKMHTDLAMVQFYYNDNFLRGTLKSPYTGFTEFMSQTGGIMSLMVGFSVVSIAEIIYFTLIKPFLDMLLRREPYSLRPNENIRQNKVNNPAADVNKLSREVFDQAP